MGLRLGLSMDQCLAFLSVALSADATTGLLTPPGLWFSFLWKFDLAWPLRVLQKCPHPLPGLRPGLIRV